MALPAVTLQRIEAVLDSKKLPYYFTDDGELFNRFTNASFMFQLLGHLDVLRMYGYWHGAATDTTTIKKLEHYVRWMNRDRYLPKFEIVHDIDGSFTVGFEYCAPIWGGLTDKQLHTVVITMFGMTLHGLAGLEDSFPELVTWTAEENGE